MRRLRLRSVISVAARARQKETKALVAEVSSGGAVLGASVWARHHDEAVFVHRDDLRKVAEELLRIANKRSRH